MTKRFLHIEGFLEVPREKEVLTELGDLAAEAPPWFKLDPGGGDGVMHLRCVEDVLCPGEEHELLNFLQMLGRKFGGKISGEFEVWWPMAVDSGPQWWSLEPDGVLYITESEIVRGEKQPYKEKS